MSLPETPITIGMLEAAFRLADELEQDASRENRLTHLQAFCRNAGVDDELWPAVSKLADLIWNRDRIVLERHRKAL